MADALRLGATLKDTIEIPGLAKLATLCDPERALFGLWEPAPHHGAQLTDEVGSLWWIEVLSSDVARARDFYGRLFGWTTVDRSFEPFDSTPCQARRCAGGRNASDRAGLGSVAEMECNLCRVGL